MAEKNIIGVSVEHRRITVADHVGATRRNQGRDFVDISLDEEWGAEGTRRRVTFYCSEERVSVQDWWEGGIIEVPPEILACPCYKITVVELNEDGTERLSTYAMSNNDAIRNPKNGHDEGIEPSERTKDVIERIDSVAADLEAKRDSGYFKGEKGDTGERGTVGPQGERGAQGVQGPQGVKGDTGERGPQGVQGIRGETGAMGEKGEPGDSGVYVGASDTEPTDNAVVWVVTDGEEDPVLGKVKDVQVAGSSILDSDGVANIPIADMSRFGLFKPYKGTSSYGIASDANGSYIIKADSNVIDARLNGYRPIVASNLDYAVKAAMTDGKGAAWTAAQQEAAQDRIGVKKRLENLEAAANGVLYREDVDTVEAYEKPVPAGAMPWASLDKVGGKTVVWNQLIKVDDGQTSYGGVNITKKDGKYTVVGNKTSGWSSLLAVGVVAHKYLVTAIYKSLDENDYGQVSILGNYSQRGIINASSSALFLDNTSGAYQYIRVAPAVSAATYVNFEVTPQIFDLTQMFGAGNEPATVEEFRAMFHDDYYPYNPGELMSAEVVEVESKGKNIISLEPVEKGGGFYNMDVGKKLMNGLFGDRVSIEHTDLAAKVTTASEWLGVCFLSDRLVSGADYKLSFEANAATSLAASMYAVDENQIIKKLYQNTRQIDYKTSTTFTVPADATRIAVTIGGTSSSGDVLNVTKLQLEKGTVATDYKPYDTKDTFPIPDEVREMCPGYGWSAGSAVNEIDFERKKYVQRVASVDLGSLGWTPYRGYTEDVDFWYVFDSNDFINCKIGQLKAIVTFAIDTSSFINKADNKQVRVYVPTGAPAPSGLMYYELATPIEVDLSDVLPDDHSIKVEAGGTLTFKNALGDDFRLPVPNQETFVISTKEAI